MANGTPGHGMAGNETAGNGTEEEAEREARGVKAAHAGEEGGDGRSEEGGGEEGGAEGGRVNAIDRHVGARLRERRVMLGLTQQQLAEIIGVTYQQAHKYERGHNRLSAGRLYTIARALGVPVSWFFEGLEGEGEAGEEVGPSRQLRELAQFFLALPDDRQREAVLNLLRAMARAGARRSAEDEEPA